jgi:hypothetical protein
MAIPDFILDKYTSEISDKPKDSFSGSEGGIIPAGKVVSAVLHGPEVVVPLSRSKTIPALRDLESGSSGGGMVNAPTTIVNNNQSSGSTTMAMASNSIDPMHMKYFRN